jgi:hypothetical protein
MVLAPYSPGGSESQSEIQRPDSSIYVHDLFSQGNRGIGWRFRAAAVCPIDLFSLAKFFLYGLIC